MAIVPAENETHLYGVADLDPNSYVASKETLLDNTNNLTASGISISWYWQRQTNISGTLYYQSYNAFGGIWYGFAANFDEKEGHIFDSGGSAHSQTTSTFYNQYFGKAGTIFAVPILARPNVYDYVLPYWNVNSGSVNRGLGTHFGQNYSSIGSLSSSNRNFESQLGNFFTIEQLMWGKNTSVVTTSNAYIDESTFGSNIDSAEIFDGSDITDNNNSNHVHLTLARKTSNTYSTLYTGGSPVLDFVGAGYDRLFGSIEINGVTLDYADASLHQTGTVVDNGDGTSSTQYTYLCLVWRNLTDSQIDTMGTSGTKSFKIYGPDYGRSYRKGIGVMHGVSGSTNIKLGDYYRGGTLVDSGNSALIPNTQNSEISMSDFAKSSKTWTTTMTVGYLQESVVIFKSTSYYDHWGYRSSDLPLTDSWGSLADTSSEAYPFAGMKVLEIGWEEDFLSAFLRLKIQGIHDNRAPTGTHPFWSTLTIGSTTYNRSDAQQFYYAVGDDSYTEWRWAVAEADQPFGTTSGASKTITMV